MRQTQQNRRGRGRNRKSQNPLTRSFESNGPDVKIRGTPSHIAEKYMSMARDALASGDPVLGENYLQHAEHYNRIIMTYREQQVQGDAGMNGANGNGRHREASDGVSGNDGGDEVENPQRGRDSQPEIVVQEEDDQPPPQRPARRSRARSNGDGEAREGGETGSGSNGRGRRQRYAHADDQPDFLKRPIRRGRRPAASSDGDDAGDDTAADQAVD